MTNLRFKQLLGCMGMCFLSAASPAFATSALTITGGKDLLFNNYLYTPTANAEKIAADMDDPVLRAAGAQQVWSFEFKPDSKTTGLRTDDVALQFDIVAPSSEIIRIHILQTAFPGRAPVSIAQGSDCAATELSAVCTLLPVPGVVARPPQANVLGGVPFLPVRTINIEVSSLPFVANFVNYGDPMNFSFDYAEAPEPAVFGLMACGLGLIALCGLRRRQA